MMAVTLTHVPLEMHRCSWDAPQPSGALDNISRHVTTSMPQEEDSTSNPPLPLEWLNGYYMPPPIREEPRSEYHQDAWAYSSPTLQDYSCLNHDYEQSHLRTASSSYPPYSHLQYPPSPHSSCQSSHQIAASQSPISLQLPLTPPPRPSASSFSSTFLEPDPLPPHSNPQALTATQSQAFTASSPIPAVRIGKDDVYCTATGLSTYSITREAAHMPAFLSTKPIVTVTRLSNHFPTGHIRFHTLATSSIEMNINGRATSLSRKSSMLHHSRRWGLQSTSTPNKSEMWYWKKDRSTGGALLEEGKGSKAKVLARMRGDLLSFEKGHLTSENYEEVVCSAVAMAEAARRAGKGRDVVDLASAIGDLASSSDGTGRGASSHGAA